jgi:hypothetical protein
LKFRPIYYAADGGFRHSETQSRHASRQAGAKHRRATPGSSNLDGYYQWAQTHNSLLSVPSTRTMTKISRLTNPLVSPAPTWPPANEYDQRLLDLRNRIVTILQVRTTSRLFMPKG